MTSPSNVEDFHAEYDVHADDRVRLFDPIREVVPERARVLYVGSYVDIAPSVWFDDVTYLDVDKRAARFFAESDGVSALVAAKRSVHNPQAEGGASIEFHHLDYTSQLPLKDESFDLLISLYAGFISEHCTQHLKVGGTLLVNPSHGDAAMASIDPRYELTGVVIARSGSYAVRTDERDTYLHPKKEQEITVESLHAQGRGIAYTRSCFAYLFTRIR